MAKKTIEQQTSDAILQKSEEFICDGEVFFVSPPCLETLIIASEYISKLPDISFNPEDVLRESLSFAKDSRILGDICAILILGAKNMKGIRVTKEDHLVKRKRFFPWQKEVVVEVEKQIEVNNVEMLSRKLLVNYTPSDLQSLILERLDKMEISAFFGLSTSLIEINLLRQTRGVGKTTVSGQ